MPNTCTMWTMRAILMHASGDRMRQQLCAPVQACPRLNTSPHASIGSSDRMQQQLCARVQACPHLNTSLHASGDRMRQQLCAPVQACPHLNTSKHPNTSRHASIDKNAREHVPT